jgi:hypothetical protein
VIVYKDEIEKKKKAREKLKRAQQTRAVAPFERQFERKKIKNK